MSQTFLYVEDDTLSREIMQIMMENLGQDLVCFEDSSNFLSRVDALAVQPQVILLDIHILPSNGFQLLDMLRQDPKYQHILIIAITASVMNEEIERLRTSGFDGAIGKPLDFEKFPMLLEQLMRGDTVWHIS